VAPSEETVVRLSTHPVATWLIRNVASRLDPLLFRASNGRLTCFGPPTMPMITVTTIGRRSGEPRPVHLACLERDGDFLVVASAMGQQRHPGWRYNLEAHPEVEVQARGERFPAVARALDDEEKREVWAEVKAAIPQMNVYEQRTDRNIRVFRLSRVGSQATAARSDPGGDG
jgi:deazaflavin-dependent oxidoreductase (nitroreductase family)